MTQEQKGRMLEILSHFISASNELKSGELWLKHTREGARLFKEHFPERPEEEALQLMTSCRTYYADLTHTSMVRTYTGTREMWGALLGTDRKQN